MVCNKKEEIRSHVKELQERLFLLSQWLYDHPELGGNEFAAQKVLTDLLEDEGFEVEQGVAGLPTSFVATADLHGEGLTVGFLAEYDALPGIGHACGHNIIAAACVGSAILLKKLYDQKGGKIFVFGTPAEETSGGKIFMANAGIFDNLDIAMSVHPSDRTCVGGSSLASHPLEISFKGRAAHAAASPEEGINALDALVEMYMAIRMMKNHWRDDVRIPGIITHGGTAPNIVPDEANARFSIRAADSDYLQSVIERVKRCAEGIAAANGGAVEFNHYEPLFEAMRNNKTLGMIFAKNLDHLGFCAEFLPDDHRGGSTDVGNVSQIVPTIHPSIQIGSELVAHTKEFADATIKEDAKKALIAASLAMAYTFVDIREQPDLLDEVREEFRNKKDTKPL